MSKVVGSKVVGIDVSKDHLDVAVLDVAVADGPVSRFANDDSGIAALVDWLKPQAVAQVVYEPTGGYELPLAQALLAAGLPRHRVHPNKVRAYAQACGLLAKTDRLDALALARYGAAFDPPEPLAQRNPWRRRQRTNPPALSCRACCGVGSN